MSTKFGPSPRCPNGTRETMEKRICKTDLSQVWSKQESLANAKVSARQQCVYEGRYRRNLRQINARNMMFSVGYNLQRCR